MYELSQLMASLRRRRRLAIILFLVLLIAGSVAIIVFPPSYATSSQVLVKRPDTLLQSTTYPQIDALLSWNRDTAMETFVAMALRPTIAQHVIDQLGLKTTVKKFLKWHVVVTPVTHSDIINITVYWRNAGIAADAANAFAHEFVADQRTLSASQASEAASSLSLALHKAQTDLSDAERGLTLFESQHELSDASTQTASILAAISDVESKERYVETERVQAQGQLTTLSGQIAAAPATIDSGTIISSAPTSDQIAQQLSQQRLQLQLLRSQFTEKYPEVIATEKQVASLEAAMASTPTTKITSRSVAPNPLSASLVSQAATLRAQITGNLEQLSLLRSQERALRGQLSVYPGNLTALAALQRQAKSAETIYNALQTNYFNAVVAKSMAVSDLSVIQEADPALAKVRPPLTLSLIAIAIIALLATLAVVVLLEWLATRSMSLSEAR